MKKHTRSQSRHAAHSADLPPVTFTIENLSHEGRGIALYPQSDVESSNPKSADLSQVSIHHKQGKKVFVRYALPNETVRAKITRTHKRFEEADALELIGQPSKDRITPICQYFTRCGGCSLQHMHPDRQISFKQQVLQSHLNHFAGLASVEWLPALRSTQTDYRRRARLGVRVRHKTQQLVLGFREMKSNYLIDIEDCAILDQRVSQHLIPLHQCLSSLEGVEQVTHLEFALGDEEIALVLKCIKPLKSQDIDKLRLFVKPLNWQLYFLADGHQSLQRVDQENATMRLSYKLPVFDLDLAFSPLDFTQVNASVNQQMVSLACELLELKQGERVLDLFCGLGNFSLALARCVGAQGQVVAVEGVEDMVQRGRENAKRNHMDQVVFHTQDLAQDFSKQSWANEGFDAILIDPPRAGAEYVMQYIAQFDAKRIVYVSCDPATLARDAAILTTQGYSLVKAGVMDMFTYTEHVESIALFVQQSMSPQFDQIDQNK